ncbi:hypothetical protein FSW04_24895 [Baekduia soli]|uniref:Uncharacterized protein n=1 Tax=Baekduia soli TaxID=496014 RepID=A0A5B8UCC7_9ACTN|nr:hypothetical protein [Baekduia soli]QEC50498.1 hypothetical protein FSW04_24895 [Baekduia soli]
MTDEVRRFWECPVACAHGCPPRTTLTTLDGRTALRLLEEAGDRGITVAELRREGLSMPAQALYEVELAGWPLERIRGRTRLRPADAPPPEPFEMPPKVRLVPRG